MKKLLFIFAAIVMLISCKKEQIDEARDRIEHGLDSTADNPKSYEFISINCDTFYKHNKLAHDYQANSHDIELDTIKDNYFYTQFKVYQKNARKFNWYFNLLSTRIERSELLIASFADSIRYQHLGQYATKDDYNGFIAARKMVFLYDSMFLNPIVTELKIIEKKPQYDSILAINYHLHCRIQNNFGALTKTSYSIKYTLSNNTWSWN